MTQEQINAQILSFQQTSADWAVSVSLGLAALLCVAFVIGFVIRLISN